MAPVEAGLLDAIAGDRCRFILSDITAEMRGRFTAAGSLTNNSFRAATLTGEIFNDHPSLKITSIEIEVQGTYGGQRRFKRQVRRAVETIEPGFSESFYIFDDLPANVETYSWAITMLRGC